MPKISGSCLCGQLSYSGDTEIRGVVNCHCSDCQKVSGATYFSNVFVSHDDLEITGETLEFHHKADSGADMTKINCAKCGSPVLGLNSRREGIAVLRAGCLDQKDLIVPKLNVFVSRKVPSTHIDSDIPSFDTMPPAT